MNGNQLRATSESSSASGLTNPGFNSTEELELSEDLTQIPEYGTFPIPNIDEVI